MSSFEYRITKHSAEAFHRVAYYCSEQGECVLNEKSVQGWELVQLFFSRGGVVAV